MRLRAATPPGGSLRDPDSALSGADVLFVAYSREHLNIEHMASAHRRFKDSVYEQLARLGKATSAPKRLELLDLLCQGPRTVEVLAREAAVTIANASQHLQVLRAARLVEAEKRGLYVEYRLANEEVCDFYLSLRGLAESRLAEVEQVTKAY